MENIKEQKKQEKSRKIRLHRRTGKDEPNLFLCVTGRTLKFEQNVSKSSKYIIKSSKPIFKSMKNNIKYTRKFKFKAWSL